MRESLLLALKQSFIKIENVRRLGLTAVCIRLEELLLIKSSEVANKDEKISCTQPSVFLRAHYKILSEKKL